MIIEVNCFRLSDILQVRPVSPAIKFYFKYHCYVPFRESPLTCNKLIPVMNVFTSTICYCCRDCHLVLKMTLGLNFVTSQWILRNVYITIREKKNNLHIPQKYSLNLIWNHYSKNFSSVIHLLPSCVSFTYFLRPFKIVCSQVYSFKLHFDRSSNFPQ